MSNEESDILQELQSLWDWQEERIAGLCARPEAQPRRLTARAGGLILPRPQSAGRRRRVARAAAAAVAVALLAAGVWLFCAGPSTEDPLQTPASQPSVFVAEAAQVVPQPSPRQAWAEASSAAGQAPACLAEVPSAPLLQPQPASAPATSDSAAAASCRSHAAPSHTEQDAATSRLAFGQADRGGRRTQTPSDVADELMDHGVSEDCGWMAEARLGMALAAPAVAEGQGVMPAPAFSAAAGRCIGDFMFGLELGTASFGTQLHTYEEQDRVGTVSLMFRTYRSHGTLLRTYSGLKAGLAAVRSTLVVGDAERRYGRCGFVAAAELGVAVGWSGRYELGVCGSAGILNLPDKAFALPEPLQAAGGGCNFSGSISLTFGINF